MQLFRKFILLIIALVSFGAAAETLEQSVKADSEGVFRYQNDKPVGKSPHQVTYYQRKNLRMDSDPATWERWTIPLQELRINKEKVAKVVGIELYNSHVANILIRNIHIQYEQEQQHKD